MRTTTTIAIATAYLLAAAHAAAAEETETPAMPLDLGDEQASDAQQQPLVTLAGLMIVGPVAALLVSCIFADYMSFALASARGTFTRPAPPMHAPAHDAGASEPAHVNLDEWLEAAKDVAPSTDTHAEDRDSEVFSDESEAPDPVNPRSPVVLEDLAEPHQPHLAQDLPPAPPPETPRGGQERPFSLFADKLESPGAFTDAVEGPQDDYVSKQLAAGEAAVGLAVEGAILAATAQNAANLDGWEKPRRHTSASSPQPLTTVTEGADENEYPKPEQLLRMAAGCEPPPPELNAPTPEGLRKRRKPSLGCAMLSRPRQQ